MNAAHKIKIIKKRTYGLMKDFFHDRPIPDEHEKLIMVCNDNLWLVDHIKRQNTKINELKRALKDTDNAK